MIVKKFTHGISFFTTPEMYWAIKKDAEEFGISISNLMRRVFEDYMNGTNSYSRPSLEEMEIEETNAPETEQAN
jgi:hypothetical protein